MKNPYWYKLILFWKKINKKTGLTIPFIIGAEMLVTPNQKLKNVTQLLGEIMNSSNENIIVLNFCNDINEYVLTLDDNPYRLIKQEFKSPITNKITLKMTPSTEILGTDFGSICESLEKRYSKQLQESTFSNTHFKWSPFSDGDKKMIEQAMAYTNI